MLQAGADTGLSLGLDRAERMDTEEALETQTQCGKKDPLLWSEEERR